ncbi:C40 family peptidase [Nocardia uniformis]|uniref:C40 family peptidase n=1 Tax=Nocardia uniformis TaxID=53432 RepID=UPI001FDEB805|nr:NlpC/P60 family protein [Nocardia uniformis]
MTTQVDDILRSLSALYGDGQPASGQSAVMMRDIAATMRAHNAAGVTGYADTLGVHTATAESQSQRDGGVHTTVATSGDGTLNGRQQLSNQLADFRSRIQAIASIGDTRFSGPALLDTAQRSITNATRQVNADVDAVRKQAAQIIPPVVPPRRRPPPTDQPVSRSRGRRLRRRVSVPVPASAPAGVRSNPRPSPQPRMPQASDGTLGGHAAAAASGWLGTPYVWGGGGAAGPSGGGFDCSGLTQYAVAQATNGEVTLPRTTYEQIYSGYRVHPNDVRPGDLVFPGDSWSHRGPEHVQLAAGGGKVIEAPYTGSTVKYSDMPRNAVVIRVM